MKKPNKTILTGIIFLSFLCVNLSSCLDCCDDIENEKNLLVGRWEPEYVEHTSIYNGETDTEIANPSECNIVEFTADGKCNSWYQNEIQNHGTYELNDKKLITYTYRVSDDSLFVEEYEIEKLTSTRLEFSSYEKFIEDGEIIEHRGVYIYNKIIE